MSVTYLLAVSEPQADAFLDQGYDLVAGFAVDAAAAAEVTDVSDLMDLLCLRFPGSPYAEDKPLDIIHLPADPFVQARHAVGPLHPGSFRGGVIEHSPFDGSGVARGGGIETDLLLVDPCRLTPGTRLWRFHPGKSEPELRGVYHGIAFGWENLNTGTFKAGMPSQFVGTVIQRDWGAVPCDVEYDADGPTALTLVAPTNPQHEAGFEQLESGMWAKRIAFESGMKVFIQMVLGELSGIPVRIVRGVMSPEGELVFQVVSLLTDAPYCTAANMQRWSTGVFTSLAKPEHVLNQRRQEAVPVSWDVSDRPAITATTQKQNDFSDSNQVIQQTFALLAQVGPPEWQEIYVRVQLVGNTAYYEAHAKLGEEKMARLRVIPTAVIHYLRKLKQLRAVAGEEPFLAVVLQLNKSGKGAVNINNVQEPKWADQVPASEWRHEMATFPRSSDSVPDWMLDRLAGSDDVPEPSTGSPFPADLTEGIVRAAEPPVSGGQPPVSGPEPTSE